MTQTIYNVKGRKTISEISAESKKEDIINNNNNSLITNKINLINQSKNSNSKFFLIQPKEKEIKNSPSQGVIFPSSHIKRKIDGFNSHNTILAENSCIKNGDISIEIDPRIPENKEEKEKSEKNNTEDNNANSNNNNVYGDALSNHEGGDFLGERGMFEEYMKSELSENCQKNYRKDSFNDSLMSQNFDIY